ncbi:MAG: WD40-repeat-containing domain protein [Benniella sp.]|nr:MAG: WD40-repeat-containing domain protein [Benniella sp.]
MPSNKQSRRLWRIDKVVRLHDLVTGQVVKTFNGHQLAVSKVIVNLLGNLIVSGSKDMTIKFWDLVSGVCIKTVTSHLGEVTSVAMNSNGIPLLSSSKGNSNGMWDIRMTRPLRKLKGHQNTSKNFIRAGFAHNSLLVGGSEDGLVFIWDQESVDILQKLQGHEARSTMLSGPPSRVFLSFPVTIGQSGHGTTMKNELYDHLDPTTAIVHP